jgi:hypothetical protein
MFLLPEELVDTGTILIMAVLDTQREENIVNINQNEHKPFWTISFG